MIEADIRPTAAVEPVLMTRRRALAVLAGVGVSATGLAGCGRRRRRPRIRLPRRVPSRSSEPDSDA